MSYSVPRLLILCYFTFGTVYSFVKLTSDTEYGKTFHAEVIRRLRLEGKPQVIVWLTALCVGLAHIVGWPYSIWLYISGRR